MLYTALFLIGINAKLVNVVSLIYKSLFMVSK
jgi:hypothetical protein